jgi:hypothetical protein
MRILTVLLSLVPILLAGHLLAEFLTGQRLRLSRQESLPLVFALGCGFVAYTLFLFSFVASHLALLLTIGLTMLLALAALYRMRDLFSVSQWGRQLSDKGVDAI